MQNKVCSSLIIMQIMSSFVQFTHQYILCSREKALHMGSAGLTYLAGAVSRSNKIKANGFSKRKTRV